MLAEKVRILDIAWSAHAGIHAKNTKAETAHEQGCLVRMAT